MRRRGAYHLWMKSGLQFFHLFVSPMLSFLFLVHLCSVPFESSYTSTFPTTTTSLSFPALLFFSSCIFHLLPVSPTFLCSCSLNLYSTWLSYLPLVWIHQFKIIVMCHHLKLSLPSFILETYYSKYDPWTSSLDMLEMPNLRPLPRPWIRISHSTRSPCHSNVPESVRSTALEYIFYIVK